MDLLLSLTSCMRCFPGTPGLKVNRHSFKILRLLGEGGFSYVYLAQDKNNDALYALQKIRCPFGEESVSLAMNEAQAYGLFSSHPNIIKCFEYSVISDRSDPGAKTVYIVLPYYRRGNLQDVINANLVNHTSFPTKQLMVLFLGVCRALKVMHNYKEQQDHEGFESRNNSKRPIGPDKELSTGITNNEQKIDRKDVESYSKGEEQKLLTEENFSLHHGESTSSEITAYAHRDIKPGNIMIDDDGEQPILMDLGSIAPSPITITSRSQAISVQDTAAQHSTMPYRAPELFDVKTGSVIDTKVDIWSLGCTLFACLVGKSPFEMRSDETGGSLSICVLSGDWRFPDEDIDGKKAKTKRNENPKMDISESIRDIVRKCLKVEPEERPDINDLIGFIEDIIASINEDGAS